MTVQAAIMKKIILKACLRKKYAISLLSNSLKIRHQVSKPFLHLLVNQQASSIKLRPNLITLLN
jgi:hypothetical protein